MKPAEDQAGYVARAEDVLLLSQKVAAGLLEAALDKGKPFKFRAGGWSMTPFIRDGDILTLSPLASPFIHKGDVVGVVDPNTKKFMVHRVVGMQRGRYRIKGDSLDREDPGPYDPGSICGRVTRVDRDGKQVRFGLGSERSTIAFLSRVPVLMWLVSKAMGLVRRIGRAEDRRQGSEVGGRKTEPIIQNS